MAGQYGDAYTHIAAEAPEECVAWVADRLTFLLCADPSIVDQAARAAITEFLIADVAHPALFALLSRGERGPRLKLSASHPEQALRNVLPAAGDDGAAPMSQDVVYFVRTQPAEVLTPEKIDAFVCFGRVAKGQSMDAFLRAMQSVYTPALLSNQQWPESIRKEFGTVAHRFMATLTEHANRLHGTTVLYVPQVPPPRAQTEQARAQHEKEEVETYVTTVIHWTRQIKEVVNEKDVGASESAGPLEEIAYWRARAVDLRNIRAQFNRADVTRIVDKLKLVKESKWSLDPFLNLKDSIEEGTREAIDNLKYLRTLEEPCERLSKATPKEIPTLIKPLLRLVQLVYFQSRHYKKDRFFRLLRMISNEIVARCQRQISLQAIFDGDVHGSMLALQESVTAGEAWITECRKMLVASSKHSRSNVVSQPMEPLEIDETVFAEIDGFVKHRCMNLMEVCKGQLQFGFRIQQPIVLDDKNNVVQPSTGDGSDAEGDGAGDAQPKPVDYRGLLPCFGGSKGPEIESQLLEIQRAFKSKIEALRRLKYNILDVKATGWSDDFRQFKSELDNLGMMTTQIIQAAFDLVATVEGGAELLEAFNVLAKREELERAVDKRKDGVIRLFAKELSFVQKELQEFGSGGRQQTPIFFLHPPMAGQAFWALSFRLRIEQSFRLLRRLWFLADSAEKTEAMRTYNQVDKKSLEEFMKAKYTDWKNNLPPSLVSELDNVVVCQATRRRPETNEEVEVFHVNFPTVLQEAFEEARFWQRLGEPIPATIAELLPREEKLRQYREHVGVAARAYNDIVLSLGPDEKRLFERRIAHLNNPKVYTQGLTKQRWSSQGVVEYFVKECRREADKVQTIVDDFKYGLLFLDHHIRAISDTPGFSIERKRVYKVDEFVRKQEEHIGLVGEKLRKIHTLMASKLLFLFDHFRADYKEDADIRHEWHELVKRIDSRTDEAVKSMFKRTFTDLIKTIEGTGKGDDAKSAGGAVQPLFVLDVVINAEEGDGGKAAPVASPNVSKLGEEVSRMCTQLLKTATDKLKLDVTIKEKIDAETDQELEERKLVRVDYVPETPVTSQTSHLLSEGDSATLLQHLRKTIDSISSKVDDRVKNKLETEQKKPMAMDTLFASKQKQLERVLLRDSSVFLEDFTAELEQFRIFEKDLTAWDNFEAIQYVRLDFTLMKRKLRAQCGLWQEAYLNLLHGMVTKTVNDLHARFDKNIEKLSRVPKTQPELRDQLHDLASVTASLPGEESEFEPLSRRFALLEQNSYPHITDDEKKRKAELPAYYEMYKARVAECSGAIERHKEHFRQELENNQRLFTTSCEQLKRQLLENGPYAAALRCEEAFTKLAEVENKLKTLRTRELQLKEDMTLFDMERPAQADLKDTEDELELLRRMWTLVERWKRESDEWRFQQFKTLVPDDIIMTCEQFRRDVVALKGKLEKKEVWGKLREDITLFAKVHPVIEDLLIPAICERHWKSLSVQLEEPLDTTSEDFCLDVLLKLHVERHAEFINNLAVAAKQEKKIEDDLNKITSTWETTELVIEPYQKYYKIASVEDINNALAEHIQILSSMKMSRFVESFKLKVTHWESLLSVITDTLEALLVVQTKWMYLENIFVGSEDIKRKLVEETKLFETVNSQWNAIMTRMHSDSNVLNATTKKDGLLDQLNAMTRDLERIQKSLESFLEDRRRAFPRFYFLSNDDLLEILGHTKEPHLVQPHLRKCFEGLFKLDLVEAKKGGQIVAKAMLAADGERVPFPNAVQVEGLPVEVWLRRVEEKMRETVRKFVNTTLDDLQDRVYNPKKRINKEKVASWLKEHEGQALITAAQLSWTSEVERVLQEYSAMGGGGRRKRTPNYRLYKKWKIIIKRYCEIVRTKLDRLQRNKLVALITIEVHSRDILNSLQAMKVCDPQSFEWTKQLRFYRELKGPVRSAEDTCLVRQTSAVVQYDNEYLGNSGRLVVTALTDRAYMTLTTALQLHRGGLPQGPAGTGKTETVKDLGKGIAKYVMVFNCSDGLDYKSLGRMFSGLAQTGGWSCFDEFNRIEVEVLSVVAQQIFCILTSVAEGKTNFLFEGADIPLNTNCGIFVTMNPGYAGRSELPDNLKALLRPISMMVPDFTLICEITLLSQGFAISKLLARRVSILYELMEKQLSKQDHYDFSLRNIKAVLVQAGNLKRENFPGTEEQLCLKACIDMNLPKFVKDDVPLFTAMMEDLFPGIEPEDAGLQSLKEQALIDLAGANLEVNDHIGLKVLHLWDTLNTRHGVMLVGRTGSGKTVTWQTLSGSLKRLKALAIQPYEPVRVSLVNPKSVTMDELYGSYNQATREWKDGILSEMMRSVCRDESLVLKWILFDGPVDTLWIESMNTVLDDNKMLTLNSGERINLTPQVSMVFEVEDLSQASPATVSRCGMVYFNVEDLGWGPYVHTWLKSRLNFEIAINAPKPEQTVAEIEEFIKTSMQKVLDFRRRECIELFPTSDINAVRSFTHLLDAVANPDAVPFTPASHPFQPQHYGENYQPIIRMLCVFATVWSVGATLTEDSRRKFDVLLRDIESSFPASETVYEYFVDFSHMSWKPWEDHPDIQRPFSAPEDAPYYSLVVPTVDTVRYNVVVTQLVRSKVHCVLVGNTGTGKSLVASQVLRNLPHDTHVPAQLNFSAQTSSKNVQEIIEGKMSHPSKKSCHPTGGRRMVCLIEDLNMPAKEKFGAQPPLELLRQWMDNGYWYDRSTQSKRQVNELQLLCCMTFGRPPISQRFLSKLNVVNITFPADNVIRKIFISILSNRLQPFPDFQQHVELLVKATVQVYQKVTTELLPIPSKSHYVFTLRDLSKVFQGIYGAAFDVISTKEHLVTLWMHEAFRTFSDRMNDPNDRQWFKTLIIDKLGSLFQTKWKSLLNDMRNPVFVDFWDGDTDETAKYRLVPSAQELKSRLEEVQENFNSEPGGRGMNLVFFNDAMEHLCRIHRIIRQPRGNALLVGLGGSGRSSLTRLASYLANFQVFTIEIDKKYDVNRFHEDLRNLFRVCGGPKRAQRVFYFSDNQIMHTTFLEDLNNMLSVGEVPNLFPKEDLVQIKDDLRREALDSGYKDTVDDVYNFFIERARRNLHLVIALSPAHKQFRMRLRQFPALVGCTTIDWFVDWPNEALKEVALRVLASKGELIEEEEVREHVADLFVHMHDTTSHASVALKETLKRYNYVTPSSYLDLVRGYIVQYEAKQEELIEQRDKLKNGMSKLEATKEAVAIMREELKIQEAELRAKTAEVDASMATIQTQQQHCDDKGAQLSGEKAKIEREKVTAEAIAEDARVELDKAMPALNDAVEALNSLDKRDLQEMKTFSKPPSGVELVMSAVQTTLGRAKDWAAAKQSLNENNFLQQLQDYDKEHMSDKLLKAIEKFVQMPAFNPKVVVKQSTVAAGLCKWVIAIHKFGLVYKEVAPKQNKLKAALAKVEAQEQQLRRKEAELEGLLAKVKKLREELQEALDEKALLQKKAQITEQKMNRAQIIVSGLDGERDLWTQQIEAYEVRLKNLVGDALLAAGFLSYAGAFPAEYRDDLMKTWSNEVRKLIPVTRSFNFVNFLVDPTDVRDWQNDGLPGDDFSCENGVVVTRGTRWPLMIDPQQQANKWIKRMERDRNLKVIDPKQPDYIKTIEFAVQGGYPVLLQDILEDIDPAIDTVVSKTIIRKGNRATIKIGDNYLDYNDRFRMYITTRIANPHYTPEICTKVCLLNFAVKEQGLEEQLLKIVVEKEKPELEEKNEKLILAFAAAEKEKKRLEDEILDLLAKSDDSLLENVRLVDTLQTSKSTQVEIRQQLESSAQTRKEIAATRELYRECAKRASILFFVLADLGAIDNMYQFALDSYILLFQNSIKRSSDKIRVETVAERVLVLNEWHTGQVYNNTCRGLFEKHKLLFSFHMTVRILMGRGEINQEEFAFFMKGGIVLDKESQTPKPAEWISDHAWDNIFELDKLLNFHGIATSFESVPNDWHAWFLQERPEEAPMPSEWQAKTEGNLLQRMLIVRCLRADRVIFMVQSFIEEMLDRRFVEPPPFNLFDTFEESRNILPLIFVLSPGVDPASQLVTLAEKKGRPLKSLALGQGQDRNAAKLILENAQSGGWVFLANCHLMVSWLLELEKIIDGLPAQRPNEHFRLWLSSIPTPQFPIGILQKAIKMTTEPPNGIKANMLRLFNSCTEDRFNKNSGDRPHLYRPLLFALCFFHSVLLERRKFGTLGYNVVYDFTTSDFEVSDNIIALYLNDMPDGRVESIPFTTIRYLVAEASYGGRVTDDWDRRVINVYMNTFVNPKTILEEGYGLSAAEEYRLPADAPPLQSYKEHCMKLPMVDPPEAFGQHPNADIASQIASSNAILEDMMSVNATLVRGGTGSGGGGGGGGGGAQESVEDRCLALLVTLDEHIPGLIDFDTILEQTLDDRGTALNTCLLQEIQRYNALLAKVHRQKKELRRAVKGELVMNEELDMIFTALLVGRVPLPWMSGFPSAKPLSSWSRDLVERVEQLVQWGRAMPKVFWLSGFTYPTGFLKSLQQQQARRDQVSVDQYGWEFSVLPSEDRTIMHAAKEGAYIRGIYLEGAGWDAEQTCLTEPRAMELVVPMPIIHFKPMRKDSAKLVKVQGIHSCPMYMYPIRTGTRERPSFVLAVDVPSGSAPSEHWSKRGTALLLSTSE